MKKKILEVNLKLDIDKELKKLNIKEIKAPEYFEDLARITLKNIDELEDKRSRAKKKLKKKRYLQVVLLFLSFTIIFGLKDVIAAVYSKLMVITIMFLIILTWRN